MISRFLLVLALGLSSGAHGADVAVVLSDSGGAYGEFATTFQQSAIPPGWRLRWVGTTESLDGAAFRADLIVAVGSEATRSSLKRSEGRPVLATLLPRQAYDRALGEAGAARPRQVTAITLDQPLPRLMAFIRQLFPDKHKVGLLTGPDTRHLLPQIRAAAKEAGLVPEAEDVEGESALVPALGQLFAKTDLLLALPDASVYRRDNIRVILLTSYRHQRPVIAFSQAFVTAGALAALYSTPSQMARQTAELLRQLNPESISLPSPQSPTLFSLAVNRNVAQSLGLSLPDDASLRRSIGADREAR